jgi:hypothetical protein
MSINPARRGFLRLTASALLAAASPVNAQTPIRRVGKGKASMVPHAVNWQIKETLGSSLKTPLTDYKRLTTIIRDGGYRGFVPIETLSMGRKDYDPAREVAKVISAMREAIAALQ